MPLIRLQQPNQQKRDLEKKRDPLMCVLRSELRTERAHVISTPVLPHADTCIHTSTNRSPSA